MTSRFGSFGRAPFALAAAVLATAVAAAAASGDADAASCAAPPSLHGFRSSKLGRDMRVTTRTFEAAVDVSALLEPAMAAAVGAGAGANSACTQEFDGATFDLSALSLPYGYYTVGDQSGGRERNYTYVFNVCRPVRSGAVALSCPANTAVPAWQILNDLSHCWALANTSTTYQWQLINPADPTIGVRLTYTGGAVCNSRHVPRSLSLNFFCSPETFDTISMARVVETDCAYALSIQSVRGCPTQCPFTAGASGLNAICSGHGNCGFDTDSRMAHCFCDSQWTGADCSVPYEPADTSIGAFGVFLILLLIVLIALNMAAVLFYLRIRAFKPQRELNQMDAEHMAASGAASMHDDPPSQVGITSGVGSLNAADPEPSVTRQANGVSGAIFTIE